MIQRHVCLLKQTRQIQNRADVQKHTQMQQRHTLYTTYSSNSHTQNKHTHGPTHRSAFAFLLERRDTLTLTVITHPDLPGPPPPPPWERLRGQQAVTVSVTYHSERAQIRQAEELSPSEDHDQILTELLTLLTTHF